MNENLKNIETLIRNGDTRIAIASLMDTEFLKVNEDRIVVINDRFEELSNDKSLNVISNSEYDLETAKINEALLDLLSSKEIQSKKRQKKKMWLGGIGSVFVLIFIGLLVTHFLDDSKVDQSKNLSNSKSGESTVVPVPKQNKNTIETDPGLNENTTVPDSKPKENVNVSESDSKLRERTRILQERVFDIYRTFNLSIEEIRNRTDLSEDERQKLLKSLQYLKSEYRVLHTKNTEAITEGNYLLSNELTKKIHFLSNSSSLAEVDNIKTPLPKIFARFKNRVYDNPDTKFGVYDILIYNDTLRVYMGMNQWDSLDISINGSMEIDRNWKTMEKFTDYYIPLSKVVKNYPFERAL